MGAMGALSSSYEWQWWFGWIGNQQSTSSTAQACIILHSFIACQKQVCEATLLVIIGTAKLDMPSPYIHPKQLCISDWLPVLSSKIPSVSALNSTISFACPKQPPQTPHKPKKSSKSRPRRRLRLPQFQAWSEIAEKLVLKWKSWHKHQVGSNGSNCKFFHSPKTGSWSYQTVVVSTINAIIIEEPWQIRCCKEAAVTTLSLISLSTTPISSISPISPISPVAAMGVLTATMVTSTTTTSTSQHRRCVDSLNGYSLYWILWCLYTDLSLAESAGLLFPIVFISKCVLYYIIQYVYIYI